MTFAGCQLVDVLSLNAVDTVNSSNMESLFENISLEANQFDLHCSPIKEYLKHKTVFITGGFGFLGKLLIEKLLRCDVKKVYLLVRGKKGKSFEERFESLKNESIYTEILKANENIFSKIVLVSGDLQKLELGIANDDQESLINEVEIVFHVAADVNFTQSLREAIETNVRGTREIIHLCRRIIKLNVLIYVSTAFCTPSFEVHEIYETEFDCDFMIDFVENLKPKDYDDFEAISTRIIQPFPNTYAYSKALAEKMIHKHENEFKIAIIRPAIIATAFHEPLPGYTDNVYGVNGVVCGAGLGFLRIFHINNKLKANIVPADYVINMMLAVSWLTVCENTSNYLQFILYSQVNKEKLEEISESKIDSTRKEEIKIFNCSVTNNNPVTLKNVFGLFAIIPPNIITCANFLKYSITFCLH
ncbi:CLUMA_CG019522, isoform A [Clunio marinus]|uniref:Fatty acyl-CoA reductase n=1 Tax=Clunio marinus TaxID=568069 RepID=A0A1J1J4E8_9DIPT|nr:CLUMA_CG019522, isoform A [Clunio marinus]